MFQRFTPSSVVNICIQLYHPSTGLENKFESGPSTPLKVELKKYLFYIFFFLIYVKGKAESDGLSVAVLQSNHQVRNNAEAGLKQIKRTGKSSSSNYRDLFVRPDAPSSRFSVSFFRFGIATWATRTQGSNCFQNS